MGLTITINWLRGLAGTAEGLRFYRSTVEDEEHPDLGISLAYSVWPAANAIELRGVSVFASAEYARNHGPSEPLLASNLRDLPFVRWDSASRSKIAGEINAEAPTIQAALMAFHSQTGRIIGDDEAQEVIASTILDLQHPGLADDQSPAGQRKYRSLHKMATTAAEYVWFQSRGRPDPVAAIAEKYNVPQATARSWVFRSRQNGFIPASASARPHDSEGAKEAYVQALEQGGRALSRPRRNLPPPDVLTALRSLMEDDSRISPEDRAVLRKGVADLLRQGEEALLRWAAANPDADEEFRQIAETRPYGDEVGAVWRDHDGAIWSVARGAVWQYVDDGWVHVDGEIQAEPERFTTQAQAIEYARGLVRSGDADAIHVVTAGVPPIPEMSSTRRPRGAEDADRVTR